MGLRLLDDLAQPVPGLPRLGSLAADTRRLAELNRIRTELTHIREKVDHDRSLLLQAKALILCSLPYRQLAARSVTRSARLGRNAWLHVTFASVDDGVPLAFGADRTLLGWIQTQAYRDGFVGFETLTEFFRAFVLSDGGREYLRFRERLRRLESLGDYALLDTRPAGGVASPQWPGGRIGSGGRVSGRTSPQTPSSGWRSC